ncbi:hypothetical protein SLEP1_g24337 [Rubroshorea leprosula]|uniref:RRM domain-containing protein n=1 Tax=Rubroshorea leprosula TaxID=152421 RepID=A0AAV5JFK9_9ROSI|nr:hypothetical protein SLEP1_g24337 [Rubroshorea leprosula]
MRIRARGAATREANGTRQRQGNRRWIPGLDHRLIKQTKTFFFYNFPENCEEKELWFSFQRCGKVLDVYVPKKRDKWGKRFGFLRMLGVQNDNQMVRRLNDIWFGSYKLRVKIAEERSNVNVKDKVMGDRKQHREDRRVQPGQSYAQVVKGKTQSFQCLPDRTGSLEGEDRGIIQMEKESGLARHQNRKEEVASCDTLAGKKCMTENRMGEPQKEIMEFTPEQEENQWLEGGLVAVVKSLSIVKDVQQRIDVDGGLITISPLGGRRVLLSEHEPGSLLEFMNHNKELCALWFEDIQSWDKQVQDRSRMAWLRINGIPLKAWSDRCFKMIGESVGEVVKIHEDTSSKSILCDGRILVICLAEQKISKQIALKVEGKWYEIQVVEEEWRSDPDWWLSDVDRRSMSVTDSEFSSEQSDEKDQEWINLDICGEEDVSIDEEQLMKENLCIANSNLKNTVEEMESEHTEVNNQGGKTRNGKKGPIVALEKVNSTIRELECKETGGRRQRRVEDYYPEKGTKLRTTKSQGAKSSTKQQQRGRADPILGAESQVNMLGSCSISDGCIEYRNNLIRKELTLHEGGSRGTKGEAGLMGRRKEVGKLVRVEQPDFLLLQETKLEKVEDNLCRMMWDSREFGWVMKESIGASGGLLCFWNKANFIKTGNSTGDGYLRISGEWGIHKMKYNLVNVYGPNDRQKRLKIWDELRTMITEEGGRWLIAGDFNAVRCLEERRGRTGETPDMKDFDGFIQSAGLIDINMANRRFTWYKSDGTAMSRLDRVLMNAEMYSMSAEWVQQGLKRNISDHCAIVLKTRIVDWGPRPFRVLDAWQLHPNFKKIIKEKWSAMEVDGFAGYKCKQKLKKLKEFLKGWNRDVFGDMEAQYDQAVKKVEHVDLKNEDFVLDEFEILHRQEGFQNMWDILRKREVIWRQKSRSNWVCEGDANTRFFHRIANGRKAQNLISGLWCDGVWVEDPIQVKKEVVNYFSKLYQGDLWNRPKPQGINFKQISTEDKQWLERPFSIEEIEEGLRSCEGSKAPGPDGYNFSFLKFAWNSLKENFMSFFKDFHRNGRLVSGLNSSFLTLIPKKLNTGNLKDYRPISLIGCMYKLLSKVLANRLKAVLPAIISETQSAFLGGRQLVDGVLVLNEVVEEVKRRK